MNNQKAISWKTETRKIADLKKWAKNPRQDYSAVGRFYRRKSGDCQTGKLKT